MNHWSVDKANKWYSRLRWPVGCNFIPSTAINQLEMWQADTFDPATIDRELGWAAGIGMNTARVYLHDLAWTGDPSGFRKRIDEFLRIAGKHGIRPIFVFFDDCWLEDPKPGRQPAPKPGVHNSGWLQSPGRKAADDQSGWPRLEKYVKDVLKSFCKDSRILMWDLYNEPGNSKRDEKSLPLLKEVFGWAREVAPDQPLTSGVWAENKPIKEFQIANSDVITFHHYDVAEDLIRQIADLKIHGRPLVCTEWLLRGKSDVATHLPIFHRERVGCLNWGLVAGKTQTIFPWGSPEGAPEPKLWFHDLLRKDGTPFDIKEIELFKSLTQLQ